MFKLENLSELQIGFVYFEEMHRKTRGLFQKIFYIYNIYIYSDIMMYIKYVSYVTQVNFIYIYIYIYIYINVCEYE